jgi:hypothetical protein
LVSAKSILYHNFDEFVHPDDKEIFNDQVTDLEKRSTFKFENRYVTVMVIPLAKLVL